MKYDAQVNISLTKEDKQLLDQEAARLTLNGKKTSVSVLLRNKLEPYLNELRNGAQAPSHQESSQDEIPPTSKNPNSFDFGDLKL